MLKTEVLGRGAGWLDAGGIKDLYQSNAVLKPLSQEKPQTSDILNQIGNISSLASASSFLDGASEHQEIIEISLSKNFVKIFHGLL